MKRTILLARKEILSYFISPMGYIYLVIFLSVTSWLFMRGFFLMNQADMRDFFTLLPWIFLLFIPAITMKLFAEERKSRTLEIALTMPVNEWEFVLGKFLASFLFFTFSIFLTLIIPVSISILGNLDWGQVIGSYIGTLFLGAAYISIGMFASSLTKNQVVAFILGAIITFFFFIIGERLVTISLPQGVASVFQFLGLGYHFKSIARGVLDTRDLIYYLSFIAFFIFLTYYVIKEKRP